MKEFLIGMGIGFAVGAIMVKCNKNFSNTLDQGVEKGKEVIEDISDDIKSQANKIKKQDQ